MDSDRNCRKCLNFFDTISGHCRQDIDVEYTNDYCQCSRFEYYDSLAL